MSLYRQERINNAICFFAKKHQDKKGSSLCQTALFKYLSFFEFGHLKEYGEMPLGLKYKAFERGPVPPEIYDNKPETDLFKFVPFTFGEEKNAYLVIAKKDPDLSYFSQVEVAEMSRLIEIYSHRLVTTALMSDASHKEIRAWQITWDRTPNGLMDETLTFSSESLCGPENELSFAEENFRLTKALETSLPKAGTL